MNKEASEKCKDVIRRIRETRMHLEDGHIIHAHQKMKDIEVAIERIKDECVKLEVQRDMKQQP